MRLLKQILVNNECCKANVPLRPTGIMLHSTGANNPNIKRYVGPDDGTLGVNSNANHWNQYRPDGRQVCVHAFIGKVADGTVATYQTLRWDTVGWHCGGKANQTHIGFEICEDNLQSASYFASIYKEAVELCVYLCKQFKLNPLKDGVIICHSEGYKRGLASNHSDVLHWFPKHDKSMDTFRKDVAAALDVGAAQPSKPSLAIKVGDNVKVKAGSKTFTGGSVSSFVYKGVYKVDYLTNERAVLDSHGICTPFNIKDLIKQ